MELEQLFLGDKITKELLESRQGESDYLDNAIDFILGKWETDVERLSEKQLNWAHKILEDMVEWRIKNKK
jgi:hypothetical protein